MSNVEDDYSDYITHMSNTNRNFTTITGFALTTLTLLITLLPDPSQMFAQVTLLFVMFLFELSGFVAGWGAFDLVYFCRKVPPLVRQLKIFNFLSQSAYCLVALKSGVSGVGIMACDYRSRDRNVRSLLETIPNVSCNTRPHSCKSQREGESRLTIPTAIPTLNGGT
jgi:hypothetical protein